MLTSTENDQRMELYNRGMTDKEVAAEIGITYKTVCDWRRNRGLPRHITGTEQHDHYQHHVPMEKVLNPEQCVIMRQFLTGLVVLADRKPGVKPDVGGYMAACRAVDLNRLVV